MLGLRPLCEFAGLAGRRSMDQAVQRQALAPHASGRAGEHVGMGPTEPVLFLMPEGVNLDALHGIGANDPAGRRPYL